MRHGRRISPLKLTVIGTMVSAMLCAFPTGPPPGVSGAPGETTCASCHDGGSGGGRVDIAFPSGPTYAPGAKQQWTITITDPDARRWGFQLSARLADNGQAGTLAPAPDQFIKVICSDSSPRGAGGCPAGAPLEYIEHSTPGQTNTFRIEWTPPASDRGPVRIYVAANAANGDGDNDGDDIYTANFTLTPQAGVPTGGPRFTAADVISSATLVAGISPKGFMTIRGENLAPVTRSWDGAIEGTALPPQLEGVSVTVGGKPAYLAYISPRQLNVVLPSEEMTGSVEVKVTTAQGSASAAVAIDQYAPGFFPSGVDAKYVAATHSDWVQVAKTGQLPGVTSRPAHPGEEIALWGTGFGPTAEQVPSGQVLTKPYPLANLADLRVTVGGRDARVTFAGVTLAGVYQINAVIPTDLPPGDHPVLAEIGGKRTQDSVFVTVEGPAPAVSMLVYYKLDPWLVYGTTGAGTWAAMPFLGPVTQRTTTFTVPARAQGLDAQGLPTTINAPVWVSADPAMVTVEPGPVNNEVKITVNRAGQASLRVSSQGFTKELVIKAALVSEVLQVEIVQY